MRLSISNIAWDLADDIPVAQLLQLRGVDAIDIAPGKYFPEPALATTSRIGEVRAWWADRGVAIVGMQSLLFGTQGLNVFGSPASQQAMLEHLAQVCRIGAGLGATLLTFGSPRNRDRGELTDSQAMDRAVDFFRRLGSIATDAGVQICLEPNPSRYGANFMTTAAETVRVVDAVDHPAIRMQFDAGAIAITGEDPRAVIERHFAAVGHIHASEPDLLPFGTGATDHRLMAEVLRAAFPDGIVTVEMLADDPGSRLGLIDNALRLAAHFYLGTTNEH